MCDLLLNLRLRRVRDLLLCRDIFGPDIASTLSEESYGKILAQQESVRNLVSEKLQSVSYEREDEFWVDCAAFFNAISEAPQLKRSQYEYMVLCKQIMHENVAVENSHDSKVLDVQSQLKREAGGGIRSIPGASSSSNPDSNSNVLLHPRLLSLAIHTLKGANNDFICSGDANVALDMNVRRVLTTLQAYTAGINSSYTGSSKRTESTIQPGRRTLIKHEVGGAHAASATVGSLSVRSREVLSSVSEPNSEAARGHAGKRYSDGKSGSGTLHDSVGTCAASLQVTLVGVTYRGREVRQSTTEDSSSGEYFAHVEVEGCVVDLGEYPTALNAARAHDRAYMRALGPRHCSPELLNFPAATYSRDSMALFTIHDAALRSALWGTAWRGPQDCDFAFIIVQQPKRGAPRSIEPVICSDGSPSRTKKSRNDLGHDTNEEVIRQDSWPIGPFVPFSEIARYCLPDFSKYVAVQSDTDSRRSCAVSRGQRYWNFDPTREAPRCRDIPPSHCYILAQELLRSKSVLAAATVQEAIKPEEVQWEPYLHPYTPREWEVLSAPKGSNPSQNSPRLPVRWERCLQKSVACQRDLSNFRTEMKLALNVLEERQERLQEKRSGGIPRAVLQGVRKLSSVHDVYVCSVQENVMDPLSRLSGSQDIDFGCFTYALEAALVREQIINPKGKAFGSSSKKRVASNFSHDEWEALRSLSGSISLLLKVHIKEKAK
jgi:hypothetical protein